MSSLRQQREFKEAFEAFSKTDEGKKQIDAINKQLENIDFGKVFHNFFAYYDEISPEQAIDELEDLYYDLSLENTANPIWKLEKHLAYLPIAIERQKKRKAKLDAQFETFETTVVKKDNELKSHLQTDTLTHREFLLIEKYKYEAKYIQYPTAKDQKAISTGRYKNYYTVFSSNNKVRKAAKRKELLNIIPLLNDYPNAKKAAENDLDNAV